MLVLLYNYYYFHILSTELDSGAFSIAGPTLWYSLPDNHFSVGWFSDIIQASSTTPSSPHCSSPWRDLGSCDYGIDQRIDVSQCDFYSDWFLVSYDNNVINVSLSFRARNYQKILQQPFTAISLFTKLINVTLDNTFLQKSCYGNEISHFLSTVMCWTRMWHSNCKISSGFL